MKKSNFDIYLSVWGLALYTHRTCNQDIRNTEITAKHKQIQFEILILSVRSLVFLYINWLIAVLNNTFLVEKQQLVFICLVL